MFFSFLLEFLCLLWYSHFRSYSIVIISNQAIGSKIEEWKKKVKAIAGAVRFIHLLAVGLVLKEAGLAAARGAIPALDCYCERWLSETHARHVA
jgi:hypothetical protein